MFHSAHKLEVGTAGQRVVCDHVPEAGLSVCGVADILSNVEMLKVLIPCCKDLNIFHYY